MSVRLFNLLALPGHHGCGWHGPLDDPYSSTKQGVVPSTSMMISRRVLSDVASLYTIYSVQLSRERPSLFSPKSGTPGSRKSGFTLFLMDSPLTRHEQVEFMQLLVVVCHKLTGPGLVKTPTQGGSHHGQKETPFDSQ